MPPSSTAPNAVDDGVRESGTPAAAAEPAADDSAPVGANEGTPPVGANEGTPPVSGNEGTPDVDVGELGAADSEGWTPPATRPLAPIAACAFGDFYKGAYLAHETPEWERSFYAVSQEQRERQLTFYLARASRPSAFSSADRGWRARSVRCRSGYDPDHQRYGPMPTR
jgi:hypothetical protein